MRITSAVSQSVSRTVRYQLALNFECGHQRKPDDAHVPLRNGSGRGAKLRCFAVSTPAGRGGRCVSWVVSVARRLGRKVLCPPIVLPRSNRAGPERARARPRKKIRSSQRRHCVAARLATAALRLQSDAQARGLLHISALPTFAMRWLIPRLPEFQTEHPALELRIVTASNNSAWVPMSSCRDHRASPVGCQPVSGRDVPAAVEPQPHEGAPYASRRILRSTRCFMPRRGAKCGGAGISILRLG